MAHHFLLWVPPALLGLHRARPHRQLDWHRRVHRAKRTTPHAHAHAHARVLVHGGAWDPPVPKLVCSSACGRRGMSSACGRRGMCSPCGCNPHTRLCVWPPRARRCLMRPQRWGSDVPGHLPSRFDCRSARTNRSSASCLPSSTRSACASSRPAPSRTAPSACSTSCGHCLRVCRSSSSRCRSSLSTASKATRCSPSPLCGRRSRSPSNSSESSSLRSPRAR